MILLAAAFLSLCLAATPARAEVQAIDTAITLQLTPAEIDVNTFYRGTDVQIRADVPNCDGAVLLLTTAGEDVTLNRVGHEAGIWLNVGRVTVKGAPGVYMLASSGPLGGMCPEQLQEELELGLESLPDRITVTSEEPLAGTEVEEFLKLMTKRGAYVTDIGITLTPEGTQTQHLSALLPVPATIPPGQYPVQLYCFKNGKAMLSAVSFLHVRSVGVGRILASLAHNHPATYGVLAVVVAMSVGLAIGILFRSLGSRR